MKPLPARGSSGAVSSRGKLSIGELAERSGVRVPTVRYYERAGLVRPVPRSEGGHRLYEGRDVERLTFIRRGRELGFSLEAIRGLLRLAEDHDRPCKEVDAIVETHLQDVHEKLASLHALERALTDLLQNCGRTIIHDCRVIAALSPGQRERQE